MDINIFKTLVDNMKEAVWIKDRDLRFTYVNTNYEIINKVSSNNILGLTEEEVFGEYNSKESSDICKRAIDSKNIYTEEKLIAHNKYSKYKIIPLFNYDGEVEAIAGLYSVDEKSPIIEDDNNIIKSIMDTLPGMVFYKDKELNYIYANEKFYDFFEIKENKVVEASDSKFNNFIKIIEMLEKDDEDIIKNKKYIDSEATFSLKDGEEIHTKIMKAPLIDSNNEVNGIVGLLIDITHIKEKEQKLKYLSYTDILTKVHNRTYFEERAKQVFKEKNLPIAVIMGDANGLKIVNDTLGHEQGDQLLILITQVLKEVFKEEKMIFRIGGDEFAIILTRTTDYECENLIKQIFEKCKNYKHDLIDLSISLGSAITYDLSKSIYELLKEAEDKVYTQKTLQKNSLNNSIVASLQATLQEKSVETKEHTERVLRNSIIIGKKLSLPLSVMDELILVAKLHDIGKIGIDQSLLLKPNNLTNEEFEVIKSHTEKGYRIIKASNYLESVAKGVLMHHERWDGEGYPLKVKGEAIPLISRIVAIADAYDVMTTNNIYRKALTKDEAIRELEKNSGKQFDPDIVKIFISYLRKNDVN